MNLLTKEETYEVIYEMMMSCYSFSHLVSGMYIVELTNKNRQNLNTKEATHYILEGKTVFVQVEDENELFSLSFSKIKPFIQDVNFVERLRDGQLDAFSFDNILQKILFGKPIYG